MFSDAACVKAAGHWADAIVQDRYRGPGDMASAMHGAARDTKVPHGFIWKLRYRRSSISLPPFQYLFNLAIEYSRKPRPEARKRDPIADALAAEFLKLAETFRGLDADIYREASAEMLASACSVGHSAFESGEVDCALAGSGEGV